jgi:spermidine dehydrogenase
MGLGEDRLPEPLWEEPGLLSRISYREFLTRIGVTEPEVHDLLLRLPSFYFGVGIDAVPAHLALAMGLPGMGSTGLARFENVLRRALAWATEPYTFHFPDGNASIARLLVRSLVPGVAEGSSMEDVVTASFDYGQLDRSDADVRLRLSSTVVDVRHDGAPERAERVLVRYVRGGPGGRTEQVRARHVVMACWGSVIPYVCSELPEPQKAALREQVKTPLVYTNVLLRSWEPWQRLGLGLAYCPGSWHTLATLDFPVSLGDYGFSPTPSDPIVAHMQRVPIAPGLPPSEQSRVGRRELLVTSFETIEREIRTQLGGMLGKAGFDPARDIEAITVNRWPHGYAWSPNPLFDPDYAPGEAPFERGRARFGRIHIANSDAGGRAYVDEAIDQAWRAVGELDAGTS